jgi:hypothetical protein
MLAITFIVLTAIYGTYYGLGGSVALIVAGIAGAAGAYTKSREALTMVRARC